jgi:hypothetical protein
MITRDAIDKMDAQKRRVKKETYVKIHEQFCRKIQNVAAAGHKQVMLTVPPFVVGYPTYDVTRAAGYLQRQLVNGGFDVTFAHPSTLLVSWFPRSLTNAVERHEPTLPTPEEDATLPSLVNLRKAANRLRR